MHNMEDVPFLRSRVLLSIRSTKRYITVVPSDLIVNIDFGSVVPRCVHSTNKCRPQTLSELISKEKRGPYRYMLPPLKRKHARHCTIIPPFRVNNQRGLTRIVSWAPLEPLIRKPLCRSHTLIANQTKASCLV